MDALIDKVVIVTGASSGIGEATAFELAHRGAMVVVTARRRDRLETLANRIREDGGDVLIHPADVTNRSEVEDVVAAAIDHFGKVDVLFNNAGVMPLSFLRNLHVDEWDQMIDVNLKGLLYNIAAVLPHMIERNEGHIINVASTAGHKIFPAGAVYCATKFGVRAISEGLRGELRPDTKIRVSVISPGIVKTELADHITDEAVKQQPTREKITPLQSEDIARATIFAIEQPPHVDVNEILVRPTEQPH